MGIYQATNPRLGNKPLTCPFKGHQPLPKGTASDAVLTLTIYALFLGTLCSVGPVLFAKGLLSWIPLFSERVQNRLKFPRLQQGSSQFQGLAVRLQGLQPPGLQPVQYFQQAK